MLQARPRVLTIPDPGASSADLHDWFLPLYDEQHIVIDLTDIDRVDPVFLGELAQLRLHRRKRGLLLGRLVIRSKSIRNAFSAIGFERHWPIYGTREEAIASFGGPSLQT
jgi:anti-anti-sigma regulatory factor